MSFALYRKYEKPLLLAAMVFTVVVFVFFPSFGSMSEVIGGTGSRSEVFGRFTLLSTDAEQDVTRLEFVHTKRGMARWMGNRSGDLTDEQVWHHILLAADARAAGLRVTDPEIAQTLKGSFKDTPMTAASYRTIWRDYLQFASARSFEEFYRGLILADRWTEVLLDDARVVGADDVYQRWRVDNERFDLDLLVFPDADPESIADPGDEVLADWFDELPDYLRKQRFSEPARYDLMLASLPLDADPASLPADKLEALDPVADSDVELRFEQQKAQRFADLEQLDDATRELLRGELRLIGLVTAAHQAWIQAGNEPTTGPTPEGQEGPLPRTADDFGAFMQGWGLSVVDPEGQLGPDELEALPDVGSPNLAPRLINAKAGDVRYFRPFGNETHAVVLFVQSVQPERPLDFAEAREQVLESWRSDPAQVAAAAQEFREELRRRAREAPEAPALIESLEQAARDKADQRIDEAVANGEELDTEARQAIADEELEAAQPLIQNQLSVYEHLTWDELVQQALADGRIAQRLELDDVPRNWRQTHTDPDVDRKTLEYFVKTNGRVFQLAEDGITDTLRHVMGKQTVIVRVAARRFPDQSAMLADADGMERARSRLSAVRASEAQIALTPDRVIAPRSADNPFGHGLRVVRPPEEPGQEESNPDS